MDPMLSQGRKLAGVLADSATNFRFEVWSYRPLTEEELRETYLAWQMGQKRRASRKNKLIQVMTNHGADL